MITSSFCSLSDSYAFQLCEDFSSLGNLEVCFSISDQIYIKIVVKDESSAFIIFSDHCSELSIGFDLHSLPIIYVLQTGISIPLLDFRYLFDSSLSFDHKSIVVSTSIPSLLSTKMLPNSQVENLPAISTSQHSFLLCSPIADHASDIPCFTLGPSVIDSSVTSPFSVSSLNSASSTVNVNNNDPKGPSDVDDDDDDLLQPQPLAYFLDANPQLKPYPREIPVSPTNCPRISLLLYSYKSFLCHRFFLFNILFAYPGVILPYLRSVSQYLHGRNRYPFITYIMPLFTSLASIYFLSISGSALFLIYGAISYLLVGRMLKISYITSKVSRRIESDIYPVLFLSQIMPLFILIFVINLFSPIQFVLLVILFYIYCQFFQYALKFSHFIGDVRMFFKLSPSVAFASFSFFGFDDPSLFIPLSFVFVLCLMILFPRIFRLQNT